MFASLGMRSSKLASQVLWSFTLCTDYANKGPEHIKYIVFKALEIIWKYINDLLIDKTAHNSLEIIVTEVNSILAAWSSSLNLSHTDHQFISLSPTKLDVNFTFHFVVHYDRSYDPIFRISTWDFVVWDKHCD